MRATVIVALLGFTALSPPAQEQRSSRDGVYSMEQAGEGARLYRWSCATCHRADEFVGPRYMDGWTGKSAAELFDLVRNTMPEEAPGSLSRPETAALVAYLFQMNGMPAGDSALGADAASLKKIRIQGPYGKE